MTRVKVFCIGAHKTGTTTMESALSMLGFAVCPASAWWNDPGLQAHFYGGQYDQVFNLIAKHDAFQDSPFNHSAFYMVLAETYPDAKFILTVRDTDHWVASRKRWRAILLGGILKTNKQLEESGREYLLREYGQADHLNIDEQSERTVYETRNQAVIEFFGSVDRPLLVMDLEKEETPWHRVCGHLGIDVPEMAFPHTNRTK